MHNWNDYRWNDMILGIHFRTQGLEGCLEKWVGTEMRWLWVDCWSWVKGRSRFIMLSSLCFMIAFFYNKTKFFFLQVRQIENNTNKANTNHKKWQSWHIPPTVSHLSANQWDKNNDNLTSTNTKLGKIFQVTKTIWNMFNDEPWFNCILYLKTLATAQRSEPLFPIFCLV